MESCAQTYDVVNNQVCKYPPETTLPLGKLYGKTVKAWNRYSDVMASIPGNSPSPPYGSVPLSRLIGQ